MPERPSSFLSISDRIRVETARNLLQGLAIYTGPHVPGFVVHLQQDPAQPPACPEVDAQFVASGYVSVPALCVVFEQVEGRWEFVRIEHASPTEQQG